MKVAEIAEATKPHQPVTACADCHQPWPCDTYREAVLAAFGSLGKTLGEALDSHRLRRIDQ